MAGTIITNDPNGLGYQTGYFAGPAGAPVDQTFFNQAFAGHINTNKIYKEAYNCNIIQESTMSTWLEEFGGVEYDCHPAYTMLEYNGYRYQIKESVGVTIPAYPSTGNITLSNKDHFVSGQYVLPQLGNSIATAPSGVLVDVISITHATAYSTILTVKQRIGTTGTIVIPVNSEMLVLQGSILTDCVCPTGQFNFRDLPIERDVAMIDIAVKGSLCGDALEKCQFLKIPFYDENGKELSNKSPWYTAAQQDMYRDLEMRKHYEKLLNPNFGVIPTLRARGTKFVPTLSTAITTDDIRDWKTQLDINGIAAREFAVFCGRDIFSQFQRMLLTAGVVQLNYLERPLMDCGWINMEYCGIQVEGLTLHIYDEISFSNGKRLGALGMNFPSSAIFVPMNNRPVDTERSSSSMGRNGYTEKMFTTVYFESINGRKYDIYTDSNGFLNGQGGRNTFGTGCKTHEWSAESRFLLEMHCPNSWGYIGLN